jgi:hypothetical protein
MTKSFYEMTQLIKPSYTALVLDDASRATLLSLAQIPPGWEKFAHHMTINMGDAASGPAANLLGQPGSLVVESLGQDDRVVAAKVKTDIPSANATKHVTIAVNRAAGGKPFHSNQLTNWNTPVPPNIVLKGRIVEVAQGGVVITK